MPSKRVERQREQRERGRKVREYRNRPSTEGEHILDFDDWVKKRIEETGVGVGMEPKYVYDNRHSFETRIEFRRMELMVRYKLRNHNPRMHHSEPTDIREAD